MEGTQKVSPAAEALERLTAALRVALRALEDMTDNSREACVALDTIERILSDGREGTEGDGP